MGAFTGLWRSKVLAAVCIAVGVVVGIIDRVVAAPQTSSAEAGTTSCPHPRTWKPTELERLTM